MVVHRERMMTAMYGLGRDNEPREKIFDVLLGKIRSKLHDAGARVAIETVWGRGWRLDPESQAELRAAIEGELDAREARRPDQQEAA